MDENPQKSCCEKPHLAIAVIGMVLLAGIIALALLRERFANPPQWQLSFSGQGKVVYKPDMAVVNLGVNVDKKAKAEEALSELNNKIKAINDAVEKTGIDKNDIQTQSYTLTPVYDYKDNVSNLSGYSANQIITVKVRKIDSENQDKPSAVIKAASAAGVNQINGVSFESSDMESLREQARAEAIIAAKKNAADLSGKLGVKLGKLVTWWENYNPTPIYYADYGKGGMGGGGSEGASPTIPSGANELIVEVSIGYLVK